MARKRWLLVSLVLLTLLALIVAGACTGKTGEQGLQGLQGETGAKGDTGPAGPPGSSTGTISGVITSAAGTPLEGITVAAQPGARSAKTDAQGAYTIADVPVGVYSVVATGTGYNAAGQTGVSVVAEGAASVNLALSAEEAFPMGKVRAVSFRTSDKEIYADEQVWLTLAKGYGASNNNIIVTSGLNNVGVGTYVYLQGRSDDAAGTKVTSWYWSVVGPREVGIALDDINAQQTRFKADAEGKYEVSIVATLKDGTTASSEFDVYAGRYIGAESCALCHSGSVMPDKVTGFKQTGHATKFEDFFGSYSAARDYCVGCHTTGYNETDKAGGFDDAARLWGWDPATDGSFMEWVVAKGYTLEDIKSSPAGKFINVTCENCHGPGSVHTKAKSYEPGVCSQCHPQEAQWRFSGHAETGAANMHMAESTDCAKCHTGQGFVEKQVRHNELVFPHMATEDNPANLPEPGNMAPVACATCHDPHAFPEPHEGSYGPASHQLRLYDEVTMPNGATVDAKESAVCVACHANKRDLAYKANYMARKNSRGPHGNTQADTFYAITAAAFDFGKGSYATSPHPGVVEEGCIQCHMAESPAAPEGAVVDGTEVVTSHGVTILNNAGGHTWSMEGSYLGTPVENVTPCLECHANLTTFNRKAYADYDGDGSIEGVQDEITGLVALVEGALPKKADGTLITVGFNTADLTDIQLMAYWNYNLAKNDGSLGVHNTAYTVQVLQRTYEALTGNAVPGATIC